MRARLAIILLLVTAMQTLPTLEAAAVGSKARHVGGPVLAQGQQGDQGGGSEQQAKETGPPWTYQMARLGGGLVLLLLLAIGWWYYRFVVKRRRGEV
jgi:hypothetical protein